MSNNLKDLRKQLRNVVLEMLPSMLVKELEDRIYKGVIEKMNARMDFIEKNAKTSIQHVQDSQKEMHAYIVRYMSAATPAPKLDIKQD